MLVLQSYYNRVIVPRPARQAFGVHTSMRTLPGHYSLDCSLEEVLTFIFCKIIYHLVLDFGEVFQRFHVCTDPSGGHKIKANLSIY